MITMGSIVTAKSTIVYGRCAIAVRKLLQRIRNGVLIKVAWRGNAYSIEKIYHSIISRQKENNIALFKWRVKRFTKNSNTGSSTRKKSQIIVALKKFSFQIAR